MKAAKRLRIGLGVIGALVLAWIAVNLITAVIGSRSADKRAEDFLRPLQQIRPGMSHEEVRRIIPVQFVHSSREKCDSYSPARGTFLVGPASNCDFVMSLIPDGVAANAEIYFARDERVVGLHYSSSGHGWQPAWGVPYGE